MTLRRRNLAAIRWQKKQFEKEYNTERYPWVLKTPRPIFNEKTGQCDSWDYNNPMIYYFETRQEAEENERVEFEHAGHHSIIEFRGKEGKK